MSAQIHAHVQAVHQRVPGLLTAKPIVVVENGYSYSAVDLYQQLAPTGAHALPLARLMALIPDARPGHEGQFAPGVRTTDVSKMAMMQYMGAMLREQRLHWHTDHVAYTSPRPAHARRVIEAETMGDELQFIELCATAARAEGPVRVRDLGEAMQWHERGRMRALLCTQLGNMSIAQQARTTTGPVRYYISGKLSRADRDDCVMALGIGIEAIAEELTQLRPPPN